jgi:hypothetical protein
MESSSGVVAVSYQSMVSVNCQPLRLGVNRPAIPRQSELAEGNETDPADDQILLLTLEYTRSNCSPLCPYSSPERAIWMARRGL